jgi:hypothetical protein
MKLAHAKYPLIALCVGFLSTSAFAQADSINDKDMKAPEWSKSDTDRDGFLSKEELIPFPGTLRNFEKIDTDKDGKISEAEYTAWREMSMHEKHKM